MDQHVQREELHHRRIDLRFYRRDDGLHEVEGRLVDTKRHAFRRQLTSEDTAPGTPLHDITVTLVIDAGMRVVDATARMRATPFAVCLGAQQTLAPLKGLQMGAGWNRKARELLKGAASCTHIVELLGPMATTAFQGLAPQRLAELNDPANEHLHRARLNSCFAYADHREVVAQLWPHLGRRTEPGT